MIPGVVIEIVGVAVVVLFLVAAFRGDPERDRLEDLARRRAVDAAFDPPVNPISFGDPDFEEREACTQRWRKFMEEELSKPGHAPIGQLMNEFDRLEELRARHRKERGRIGAAREW